MLRHVAIGLLCLISTANAQVVANPPRVIKIDNVDVRVRTSGLDQRRAGQPVIVLEAGSGADLDTWNPIFDELATLAPVIAYDRFGLGQSGADPKTPTLTRNVETLHDVLGELAKPPYLLVGHSLGGVIIHGFNATYPTEAVGLVYLDAPDFEATRDEQADLLTGDARTRALQPPSLPEIPSDTSAKLRPVYEQLLIEMRDDFPSARKWKQSSDVPVGVVVTARADRLQGSGAAMVRLQIRHQSEWTLGSPDSTFAVVPTGHQVHRDDPAFVVSIVKRIYGAATKKK